MSKLSLAAGAAWAGPDAVAELAVLESRIEALETALKDWIHQAGMFAHWSPDRIKEAIKPYFALETKGDVDGR